MAGEIQLNSVSLATESNSAITLGSAVSLNSAAYASTSEVQGTHTTGTITSGTTSLTVASGSGISNGDYVVGEGIAPGTVVSSGGGTTSITLSANAAATLSSDPVSFYTANKALSPGLVAGQLCRAWVNFKGTGTVAIRASYNVSSITDNGGSGGDYTVNFTTAMPDADYSLVCSTYITPAASTPRSGRTIGLKDGTTPSTSSVRIMHRSGSYSTADSADSDAEYAFVSIFR